MTSVVPTVDSSGAELDFNGRGSDHMSESRTRSSPSSVPVIAARTRLCMRCELPFRQHVDDEKYRWCSECREKKREKNKKERTTKKRKIVGNPSFAADNPVEHHFKRFDSFDRFLDYISHRPSGEQTDAIYQTVFSESQIPRFPKHFNFVSIGAKTIVRRRGYITNVSGDDDEVMNKHIESLQLAPVVASYHAMKSLSLVTTPVLSLVGIYVQKRIGLIIVNQHESKSFIIQNSARFLDMIVNKLLQSPYRAIFELNSISSSKLQEEISKLFVEHNVDQHDALAAYRLLKLEKFNMLRDLPRLLSGFQTTPKVKNVDQAKLLRQQIDEQLIKFADNISGVTGYQYARKRRDVSQNGNFVINHYCRQDSHYRKLSAVENRKTEDCKSKLAFFYNSINGDFKIVYSHREHPKDFVDQTDQQRQHQPQQQHHHQITQAYLDRVAETDIDVDLIAHQSQQQQQALHLSQARNAPGIVVNTLMAGVPTQTSNGVQINDPSANPQWKAYSNVLNFENVHNMGL